MEFSSIPQSEIFHPTQSDHYLLCCLVYIYIYIFNCIYFSIYFWLCWVFMAAWAFPELQQGEATFQLWHAGLSPWCLLLLQSMSSRVHGSQQLWLTSSRATGSIIVAHGLSSSGSHGILLNQGSNPCLLHWQMVSPPLSHQAKHLQPHTFFFSLFQRKI